MNYNKAKSKQIKLNLADVERNLSKPEYKYKIKRWCEKYDFDFETIFNKAKKDYYFRAIFAKDPNKQNIFEKNAAIHIKDIEIVKNFKKLNNHGSKSLFLENGKIIVNDKNKLNKPTKTIDFYWEIIDRNNNVYKCYAYHKYIKEMGGAQDNQYNDVKNSIQNANFSKKNQLFFFICDGEYFTNSKFNKLKSLAKSKNIYVHKIIDLKNILEKFISNGMNEL